MAFRTSSLRFARILTNDLTSTSKRSLLSNHHERLFAAPVTCNNFTFANRNNNETLHKFQFSTKSEEKETPSTEESTTATVDEQTPPTEESTTTTDETPEDQNSQQISKEASLQKEIATLKDSLLRSLAEAENTRRIASRDISSAKSFAISSFAKSLLETSDNLSRALEAVPEELRHDHENHPVLANLYEGISMTNDGLDKAFAKNGLKKFGVVGEKFDPNLHEALFEYEDEGVEKGCVGQVMKVGFMLNERVVRPAEVGVVKG